ncbi:glucose-6-phosphate isomerase [Candidatus Omnitrophota bacterium]
MQKDLRLDTRYLDKTVTKDDFKAIFPEVEKAHALLESKSGPGSDYLGWVDLPENVSEELIEDIENTASAMNRNSDAIIIVGIGGSYLGARATVETLSKEAARKKIFFAGHNMSCEYLSELLHKLKDKDVSVNVISKSGTTTEPAIAFRILEDFLKKKYGPDKIKDRIVCTTDSEKGALKQIADKRGYKSFVIPDDVGGRFSVLTPVGLFPIACAGINIRELIEGAREQRNKSLDCDLENNMSYKYAAARNCLYRKGKRVEILASFNSKLHYVDEWWKQLFAESEGKNGHSIFPASCDFSTDLHSMGQLIQQGERNLFETFLVIEDGCAECKIPEDKEDLDNLNYLAGKQLSYVNRKAYEATAEAHFEGGVPNLTVFIPKRTAFCLGQLYYFFEKAVSISAYMSGVNPFDQPGVEAYKNKMFKLLGKPGN